ncbi:hypothetical protein Q3G72_029147 [Acer saccharum]|nr:hypothetical protein Q3G72_029147 [Acer saccharum]
MVRIREPIEDQQPGDTKQLHSHHEQSKEEDNKKKENPDVGDKDDVNSRRKTKRRKKMVQEMTNDVRSVQFSSRLMWPPGVLILIRQSISLSRPATRVLKKKKLKINVHRPLGSRVVFDEEGNTLPPLAMLADAKSGKISFPDQKKEYYKKLREELKHADREDKLLDCQHCREKRVKEKMKRKKGDAEDEEDDDNFLGQTKKQLIKEDIKDQRYTSIMTVITILTSYNDSGDRKENRYDKNSNADSISQYYLEDQKYGPENTEDL